MNILEALRALDPENNEQWTGNGMPRVDVINTLMQREDITRKEITEVAPKFNRETLEFPVDTVHVETAEQPEEASKETAVPEAQPAPEEAPVLASSLVELDETPLPPANPEIEALQVQLAELEPKMNEAYKIAKQAKHDADTLSDQINTINRKVEALTKEDPNWKTAGIRRFIQQQNLNRLKRAEGMQQFMKITGVRPGDVAKAVDPRAPIDKAMGIRKGQRGTARPQVPRLD